MGGYKTHNELYKIRKKLGCPICYLLGVKEEGIHSHSIPRGYQKILADYNGEVYHLDYKNPSYNHSIHNNLFIKQNYKYATAHNLLCNKHDIELFSIIEKKNENGEICVNDDLKNISYRDNCKYFIYAFRSLIFDSFNKIYNIVYFFEKNYKIEISSFEECFEVFDKYFKKISLDLRVAIVNLRKVSFPQLDLFIKVLSEVGFNSKELAKNKELCNFNNKVIGLENLKTKVFKIDEKVNILACDVFKVSRYNNMMNNYYINIIPGKEKSYVVISYFKDSKFIDTLEEKFNTDRVEFYKRLSTELISNGVEIIYSKMLVDYLIKHKLDKEIFALKKSLNIKTKGIVKIFLKARKIKQYQKTSDINLFVAIGNK